MTNPSRHLSAITALVDTAQRHAARLAARLDPDSLPAVAAVALQQALECAQVQALFLGRTLRAPPTAQEQDGNKEGTTPCLPHSPAAS